MINYIVQVVLFQLLFLVIYDVFLHRETFFKHNRWYLLGTPILSFVLPFIKIQTLQTAIPQETIHYLPEVVLNPQTVIERSAWYESINYLDLFFYAGVVVFSVLFLLKLFKIVRLLTTHTIIKKENYNLVVLNEDASAFSFFNYIFIYKKILEKDDFQIIQHELVHCKQYHTLDLLFFEFLKIAMWFNPLVYVFQKRMMVLHEYISDAEVVKETDRKSYFNRLLSESFKVEEISFINQFYNHSLIKKRVVMITKNKSRKGNQLKYLLILPLLVGMLFYVSCENAIEEPTSPIDATAEIAELVNALKLKLDETENLTDEQRKLIMGLSLEALQKNREKGNNDKYEIEKVSNKDGSVPFAMIEEVPLYPGGEELDNSHKRAHFSRSISQHVFKNFNADLAKGLGLKPGKKKIFVIFKIDKEGYVTDVRSRAPHKDLEDEAIRVIKSLPKMKPGMHKGEVVEVKYSLPITFNVD